MELHSLVINYSTAATLSLGALYSHSVEKGAEV